MDNGVNGDSAPVASRDVTFSTFAELIGEGGSGASEVVAYENGSFFVTNGENDRIDIFDNPAGTVDGADRTIDLSTLDGYDGVQSVAVKNGVVAAAIARPAEDTTVFGGTDVALSQAGFVALFDANTLALLSTVDVGNLPDQIAFNADGSKLLVAGEGEKNEDSEHDDNPLGTVAIVDTTDPANPSVELLDFTAFNGLEEQARAAGIRIQDGVSFAEDVEPEYTAFAFNDDGAFVSLQENNAIAELSIAESSVVDVFLLGLADFENGSKLDVNDNGVIEIGQFPSLVGFRMPDAIATYEVDGETYIVTANEGDSRGFDEARISDLVEDGLLDPALAQQFRDAGLIDDDPDSDIGIERLEVSSIDGDTDGDGDIDVPHTFSTRSFSIFDEAGNLVFDSGSDFEEFIASIAPERFNDDEGTTDENRSDAKGPEPEAVTVGQIGERFYAFIGLERDSGVIIYDVTDPENAFLVNYIEPRFIDFTPEGEVPRVAPEVIAFIEAGDSLSGSNQIAVSYEETGTTFVYDLGTPAPRVAIADIQGTGHSSPLLGETVRAGGVVTAVDSNGFYLQDASGDGDDATSDAVFVFTFDAPNVAVGDQVVVQGDVSEFFPGGEDSGNLSTTQIGSIDELIVISSGNELPAPVIIGENGRPLPTENIDDDAFTSFDPNEDGIDLFESLESMRVTGDDLVAVAGTNRFGEIFAVTDNGANATGLSTRGTLNISPDDFNPERVQIDEDSGVFSFDFPMVDVGAFLGDVTGVLGYSFGSFEIIPTEDFTSQIVDSTLQPEVSELNGQVTIASYNVLNLDPIVEDINNVDDNDPGEIDDDIGDGRFDAIAGHIVTNLGTPDIIGLQEVQDNTGAEINDGVTAADVTLQTLIDAIVAAGGPAYAFVDNTFIGENTSGGQPGGNIRTAFLYNPESVDLVDSSVTSIAFEDQQTNPDNPFFGARLPLVATFEADGHEITVINNHLSSKGGSAPIFGVEQPFEARQEDVDVNGSLDERQAQAGAIKSFIDEILNDDPDAYIAVTGDFNEFEFVSPVQGIAGEGIENLTLQLDDDERYSFIFQGNSQALDHIMVSDNLAGGAQFDAVHVNSEFAETDARASDHDPLVASLQLDDLVNGDTTPVV